MSRTTYPGTVSPHDPGVCMTSRVTSRLAAQFVGTRRGLHSAQPHARFAIAHWASSRSTANALVLTYPGGPGSTIPTQKV